MGTSSMYHCVDAPVLRSDVSHYPNGRVGIGDVEPHNGRRGIERFWLRRPVRRDDPRTAFRKPMNTGGANAT